MQVYKNRLNSFQASDGLALWPHEGYKATPELLAAAGFFYRPKSAGSDNVRCFLCEKELDGWSAGDHPYTEHARHAPLCPWVLVKCLGRNDLGLAIEPELSMVRDAVSKKEGNYSEQEEVELGLPPRSKIMETARLKTFGDWWPHDGKRGWLVKGPKLAKAGFYYAPSNDAEDTAVCGFCQLTLDRWEPRDSPVNEHRERHPNCLFFYKPKNPNAKSAVRSTRPTRISSRRSSVASTASALDHEEDDDDNASVIGDTQSVHEPSPDHDRDAIAESARSGVDNDAVQNPEPEPPTPAKRGRKPKNATGSKPIAKQTSKGERSKAPIVTEPTDDAGRESDDDRNDVQKRMKSGDVNAPKKRMASTKAKEKIAAQLEEHKTPPKKSSKEIKPANKRSAVESEQTGDKPSPGHIIPLVQRNAKPKATTRTGRSTRATQPTEQIDANDQEKNTTDVSAVGKSSGQDAEVETNIVSDSNEQEGEAIQITFEGGTGSDKLDAKNKKTKISLSRKGTRKVKIPDPVEPEESASTIRQAEVSNLTESSQIESPVPIIETTTVADNTGLSVPAADEPHTGPVRKSKRVLKTKAETAKRGRPAKMKAVDDPKPVPQATTTTTPSSFQNEEPRESIPPIKETDAVDECNVPQDENVPPIHTTKSQAPPRRNLRRKRESSVPTLDPLTTTQVPNRTDAEDVAVTDGKEKRSRTTTTKKIVPVILDVPQTPCSSRLVLSTSKESPSESEEDSESEEEENLLSDQELSARYGVTERELDMTVEEYMKSILQAQVHRLQSEGEKMVQKLLDEAERVLAVS